MQKAIYLKGINMHRYNIHRRLRGKIDDRGRYGSRFGILGLLGRKILKKYIYKIEKKKLYIYKYKIGKDYLFLIHEFLVSVAVETHLIR